ncbi:hypothetical protein B0O80DRAFT_499416 [Mortierella sp. GBAus27b]|nr:hypothetical protein B0O80DRAFT_499416 [Mortierella sp. GBAus27b]
MTHTYFTNPVGDGQSYNAGDNTTFSWQLKCVAPNTYVSANPSAVSVQLVNSTNSNNAFFLAEVTTIDCTKDQGNNYWVVPEKYGDNTSLFSLKIVFDGGNAAYSGRFNIKSKGSPVTPPTTNPSNPSGKPSSANAVVPALSGLAAAAAAAMALL